MRAPPDGKARKDTSWVLRQASAQKNTAKTGAQLVAPVHQVGVRKPTLRHAASALTQQPLLTQPPMQSLSTQSGMVSSRTRERMVERVRAQGVRHPQVLHALQTVPRHLFVEEGLASRAYEDTALPIGHGQTISQPYIVGRMIELLLQDHDTSAAHGKVLEIGTGCGYQAAVLAALYTEVVSVERIRALHELARNHLRPLRLPNVRLVLGDGMLGVPQCAPFDAIILAAAGLDVPPSLLTQLRVGGRLIAPVGQHHQRLVLIERTTETHWAQTQLDAVRFVPLLSGTM